MSTEQNRPEKDAGRDHGPQGTHVFSRGEVDRLIEDVGSDGNETRGAHLKGRSEGVRDQIFALRGKRVTLGRASSCDVIITDASVSSEHARLTREADGWRVANLLSTNGTFVNNTKTSNGVLKDGDRLRLGRVEFLMQDPEASSGADRAESSSLRWLPWVGAAVVVVVIAWIALS